MGGEVGRGRATKKPITALKPAMRPAPKVMKMAVTNQGMGDPPLRQTTIPISESTTNHAIKLAVEGMGLSTRLAQTMGVLTQDGSCGCSCCKVMVVCRSKGQGAG